MKKMIFIFLTILFCTGIALAVEPNPGSRSGEMISGESTPGILLFQSINIGFPDDWQFSNTSGQGSLSNRQHFEPQ